MSERKCVICKKGPMPSKTLISNPDMIAELALCCKEQVDLGQTHMKQLSDQLAGLSESERNLVYYHSECRKPLVNKQMMERLRTKRDRSNSPVCPVRGPGRPSTTKDYVRPKRTKSTPKEEVCLFSSASFCSNDPTEPLHRVFSDKMGENLLQIKLNTTDDRVRTCVSDLEDVGDASALEKYYHRNCLRSAQRTFSPVVYNSSQLIRSACDEQLIHSVQNTLANEDSTITMAQVNDEYLSLLTRYQMEISDTGNYRKHLKSIISDRLPNVQFIKSLRKNEPDNLVLPTTVSKAMDLRDSYIDEGETISYLKRIAAVLRDEIMQHRNWSFNGSFDDFENPPLLQFFITQLLFGRHVHKVSGMRNDEVDKSVDVACQLLVQNTRTDRQVQHQSKRNDGFQQTVQTPLSVGLPLAIHSRVRDKHLLNNLTNLYIGCDYQKILNIEKRIQQGILQRIDETGGFCLPDFVKKGVNTWFAVDNIDLLEDTPTGQNTLHGTVIVINQRAEDGETINGPLVIPEKFTPTPLAFKLKYLQEPVIRAKPIRFATYELGKRNNLLSPNFTHTWALASYFAADDNNRNKTNNPNKEKEKEEDVDKQPDRIETPDVENQNLQNPEDSILSLQKDIHTREKLAKEAVMPTWAATKSLLLSQSTESPCLTNSEVVAPLFKTSPTDYATLYTVLMLTQGISAFVVGPERRTIITLDLDLYNRALHIQQSVDTSNWILRAGALHIVFAALHALGKTVDGSGIDTCAIESGTYTAAALRGIYSGKAYKRGVEYHITNSLAIMMMKFDAISTEISPGPLHAQCDALKTALHQRSPDMIKVYKDLESSYIQNIKPHEENCTGELAQFLMLYLQQVESLLQFISAARSGDWELYLAALENLVKYFFTHDLLNYARLMPVHLAQMNSLETNDPVVWEALKSGDFVVSKTEVPFTRLFTDQTLEQEIKMLKRHGGMVGLSQDEVALDRLVTITPHLTHLVTQFLHSFPKESKSSPRTEHYQLSGSVAVRSRENAAKLRQCIEHHSEGNPFATETPLKNIVSSALVKDDAKDDILHFAEKGQKRFQEFIDDRLLPTSTLSVWDPMKKLKVKTFLNLMEKAKIRVGDKVIKLREERELLGRFLIVQGTRPELVPKLEETIGQYEMSVVPRSICAVDGSLYIPADKSSMMHAIEGAKSQPTPSATQLDTVPIPSIAPPKVLIVDAMAVVQSMKKTATTQKFIDLQEAFVKRIEFMMVGYSEGRVVFDRYQDQSLKNKTRQKRAVTTTEFKVHPQMKLTMSLKELLSSSKTKRTITCMFAQALLQHFSNGNTLKLAVVYDSKIKGPDFEDEHSHEEADTLIPHQVLSCTADNDYRDVYVWSPDTDILILLLDLVSRGRLGSHARLKFVTGKATKHREIDVIERVQVIGRHKCQGLIGLHNFSGADWGGKFVGITKKTWISAYMALDDNDSVVSCFQELGDCSIPKELINGELPAQVKDLERFVCQVYSSSGPSTIPALRWQLFRSKNLEGEMLPPTRAALLPHISRANYIASRDKSYDTNHPDLPPIEQNGWQLEKGMYTPVRCLILPAPRAVVELTRCACKTGCSSRCTCYKNGLPCTPLCKCYASNCTNIARSIPEDEDEDDK